MIESKALASNAGWALAGADGLWNPFNDNFSFSLLLHKFPLQKVDEKILEEFKNSSRHNFNIKVDEVIRPKMATSLGSC